MVWSKSILSQITYRIKDVSESPGLDARVLLADVLGRSPAWILAHTEATLDEDQAHRLESALLRLEYGEPLPYVLGHWEFYGLDLQVTPQVLIPRPETELLVDAALAWLQNHPDRKWVVDVGTGSGAIAVAVAVNHLPAWIVAVDRSFAALQVAAANITRYALQDRVGCVQADLAPPGSVLFDLICANLPYIPRDVLAGLRVARWEPMDALDGGLDGLDVIRRLLHTAPARLAPGGAAFLEIEASQGEAVVTLARQAFPGQQVTLHQDLAGRDRLVSIQTSL